MTIVGKILVFINLVFSFVVGALVVVVYLSRTNYYAALKESERNRTIDRANLSAYQAQVEAVRTELQASLNQEKAAHTRTQNDLSDERNLNKILGDKLLAEAKKTEQSDSLLKAAEAEVARRQTEVERIRATLVAEITKGVQLTKEKAALQDRTTSAELLAKQLKDINARLEEQMQQLARDNARIRATGGVTTTVAKPGGKNPPPESIEGLIKTTNPDGLLFKITLGTDAGLVRGHTLEVYRPDLTNPVLSKYLGTIRIIEVNATEAVGQPIGKMLGPVKIGDRVASRILGS